MSPQRIAIILLPFALASLSNAAEAEWIHLFEDAEHGDFYFDFLEETDPEEVFEFKADGTLSIKGEDQPIGYLQTLDEYSDFELELEWRWPDEPGEGGVHIHSSDFPARLIWPESLKIDLSHEKAGDFWLFNTEIEVEESQMPLKAAERDRRLRLTDVKNREPEKKPGQWNRMRIVAKGDTVEVHLNDKLVNEGKACSREAGYLTFAAEESNLELRKVRLRELEP